jgi:hypothetical protein
VVQREECLERFPFALPDRDEVDEFPVVLRREADALLVRDAPQGGGVDRSAEVDVELGQLIAERMGDLAALLACRWTAHPPAAPWSGGTAFGMLVPDDVSVVVR